MPARLLGIDVGWSNSRRSCTLATSGSLYRGTHPARLGTQGIERSVEKLFECGREHVHVERSPRLHVRQRMDLPTLLEGIELGP
jgi:hypothetical protein